MNRLAYAFGIKAAASMEKFKKSFEIEDNKKVIDAFFMEEDAIDYMIVIPGSNDNCVIT